MTNPERVIQYLARISPRAATNRDIRAATGIKPHQQVFQITANLVKSGKSKGRQFGTEWHFWIE